MEKKIYNTVESVLQKAELRYTTEEGYIFLFGIKGKHANIDVRMICEEKMEFLMTIVSGSMFVPEDKIDCMCRWIAEKNYGLTLGEFKLDPSDGELSFRITCPLDKGAINEDIVLVSYVNAVNTFDDSYEEIIRIIYLGNDSDED